MVCQISLAPSRQLLVTACFKLVWAAECCKFCPGHTVHVKFGFSPGKIVCKTSTPEISEMAVNVLHFLRPSGVGDLKIVNCKAEESNLDMADLDTTNFHVRLALHSWYHGNSRYRINFATPKSLDCSVNQLRWQDCCILLAATARSALLQAYAKKDHFLRGFSRQILLHLLCHIRFTCKTSKASRTKSSSTS